MILIGSSGVNWGNYNTVLAMVAENGFTAIPYAVLNFSSNLQQAFHQEYPVLDSAETNVLFDLKCSRLMNRVLFINVCLSNNATSLQSITNIGICIRFINDIMEYKRSKGQLLAILDMRMTGHSHVNNINLSIVQDLKAYEARWNGSNSMIQYKDDAPFEIVNTEYYHLYRRFGNLGYKHYDSSNDSQEHVKMLREIDNAGFPIKEMYHWF